MLTSREISIPSLHRHECTITHVKTENMNVINRGGRSLLLPIPPTLLLSLWAKFRILFIWALMGQVKAFHRKKQKAFNAYQLYNGG